MGGVNRPKLVDCYDSHGHRHKQLVSLQSFKHICTREHVLYCLHITAQRLPAEAQRCTDGRLLAKQRLAFCPLYSAAPPFQLPLVTPQQHALSASSTLLTLVDWLQVKSGNDDLRQDAVMQQFFELINRVLAASASSASRKLRIATYKVRHQMAGLG